MGGYSYLNNAAICAERALTQGASKVAVLDVDYHHGNGTQDIFYTREEVLTVSLHADPKTDYPFYWGHADETGEGQGAGFSLNLPMPRGTLWSEYQAKLVQAIERVQAFEEVGAHCVYVPMPPSMDALKTLCASVSVPVNALCAGPFVKFSKADFARIGVARISVGSALARVTHKMVHDIGQAMIEKGDFSALALGMSGAKVDALLDKGAAK